MDAQVDTNTQITDTTTIQKEDSFKKTEVRISEPRFDEELGQIKRPRVAMRKSVNHPIDEKKLLLDETLFPENDQISR